MDERSVSLTLTPVIMEVSETEGMDDEVREGL